MSAPGVAIAEGNPPFERIAGVPLGVADGQGQQAWEALGVQLGTEYVEPLAAGPAPRTDYYKPDGALGMVAAEQQAVQTEQPQEAAYRLGGVMLKAAGIRRADSVPEALAKAEARSQQVIEEVALSGTAKAIRKTRWRRGNTLSERLELTAAGDAEAEAAVNIDTLTEVAEQVVKAGGILKTKAAMNQDGELEQFGQTTYRRQINTLQATGPDELSPVAHIEGRNGFLIEEHYKLGNLRDNRFVEWSFIPQATRAALAKRGYYLREVLGIVRVTTVEADGTCEIVSALVGGTAQDEVETLYKPRMTEAEEAAAEEFALANRFDVETLRRINAEAGVSADMTMTPTQQLATPWLMSKKFDALDVAQLVDTVARGVLEERRGKPVAPLLLGITAMPGENGPRAFTRADYEARERQSAAYQEGLTGIAADVARELVRWRKEATGQELSLLLRDIAKNHAVAYLVTAENADAKVYGPRALEEILVARERLAAGDIAGANRAIAKARQEAKPTGCPVKEREPKLAGAESDDGKENESADNTGKIRCIKCRKDVDKRDVVKADCWECPKCGHKVDICDGRVLREGKVSAVRKAVHTLQDALSRVFGRKPKQAPAPASEA